MYVFQEYGEPRVSNCYEIFVLQRKDNYVSYRRVECCFRRFYVIIYHQEICSIAGKDYSGERKIDTCLTCYLKKHLPGELKRWYKSSVGNLLDNPCSCGGKPNSSLTTRTRSRKLCEIYNTFQHVMHFYLLFFQCILSWLAPVPLSDFLLHRTFCV